MRPPESSDAVPPPTAAQPAPAPSRRGWTLTLGALGVVFGDIGTDPLFSLRECFAGVRGDAIPAADVLGVVSLILWAFIGIVCIKYLAVLFRASNQGEGGILALLALNQTRLSQLAHPRLADAAIALGLFGAGLLFADAVVTPAISVLSAVEGLREISPDFAPWVVPFTVAILVALFALQPSGTGRIGAGFGPIMIVWFVASGAIGVPAIAARPDVLLAANPLHALHYLVTGGWSAFLALGGVVLTIAGVEALYADMGHFGKGPIRLSWFAVVMPSLVLNYLGQGALVLERGAAALQSAFFGLVPAAGLVPMVALATAATVIASQSLISGTFSLTEHAIQLGYLPPWRVRHTSEHVEGQIYVPIVNWLLLAGSLALVLALRDSAAMGGMYGMAVIGSMLPVTVHFYISARHVLGWSRTFARVAVAAFLAVDLAMLGASLPRLAHGAWVPLAIGAAILGVMWVWRDGTTFLRDAGSRLAMPLDEFARACAPLPRYHGTAVFFGDDVHATPHALRALATLKGGPFECNLIVTIVPEKVPRVDPAHRVAWRHVGGAIYAVTLRRGYREREDVVGAVTLCAEQGVPILPDTCAYWLDRNELIPAEGIGLTAAKLRLFAALRHTAQSTARRLRLPPDRVTEIGVETDIAGATPSRIRRF
jgi:KUP system potassium uptake protein